jgi:hypothetical protein
MLEFHWFPPGALAEMRDWGAYQHSGRTLSS